MSKKEKKKDGERKIRKKEKAVISPMTPPEDIPAPESAPGTPPPLPRAAAGKSRKTATPKTKTTKPKAPKTETVAVEIVISNDDIALRAYYIAERRQNLGHPGDHTGDWVEAERQLREEAKQK